MLKQKLLQASRTFSTTKSAAVSSLSGKTPPESPRPDECCGSGCSDCPYLRYAEKLVDFYKDGGDTALQEVRKIADVSVRVFVQNEIKFYLSLDEEARRRLKKSNKPEQKLPTD